MKRRIRESYRLRKHDLISLYSEKNKMLLLAFLYLDNAKSSYAKIDRAMTKAIHALKEITE
jgi:ribonuclease P protein component